MHKVTRTLCSTPYNTRVLVKLSMEIIILRKLHKVSSQICRFVWRYVMVYSLMLHVCFVIISCNWTSSWYTKISLKLEQVWFFPLLLVLLHIFPVRRTVLQIEIYAFLIHRNRWFRNHVCMIHINIEKDITHRCISLCKQALTHSMQTYTFYANMHILCKHAHAHMHRHYICYSPSSLQSTSTWFFSFVWKFPGVIYPIAMNIQTDVHFPRGTQRTVEI